MADQAASCYGICSSELGNRSSFIYDPANLGLRHGLCGTFRHIDPVRPEVKGAVAEAHSAGTSAL